MLEYHENPWPHFTGSLPDDFYNHVKTMWDEDDTKKKWNKCKNRSNLIIEDDKINTILNDISLGILTKSKHEGCFDFNGNMEVVSTNNHKLSVQKVNRVFGEHLTIQSPSVQVKAGEGTDPDNRVGFVNDKKIPYLYQSSLTNLYSLKIHTISFLVFTI